MTIRTPRTFLAGLLVGAGLWLPVFVVASSEGDAPGWTMLWALGLFALAALLAMRFPRSVRPAPSSRKVAATLPAVVPQAVRQSESRVDCPPVVRTPVHASRAEPERERCTLA